MSRLIARFKPCIAFIILSAVLLSAPSAALYAKKEKPKQKVVIVYITDTGSKYHRGSCRYLRYSKHAIEKSKAIKAGYTPCKICRP